MWVPGNKTFLTALLEYLMQVTAVLQCFDRFSERIQIMLQRNIVLQNPTYPTCILHDDLYQAFSVGGSRSCFLFSSRSNFP